jgi:hypothetical protein
MNVFLRSVAWKYNARKWKGKFLAISSSALPWWPYEVRRHPASSDPCPRKKPSHHSVPPLPPAVAEGADHLVENLSLVGIEDGTKFLLRFQEQLLYLGAHFPAQQ